MDPKLHPLTRVQQLIKEICPAPGGTYCLYAENDELKICSRKQTPTTYTVIALLNSRDINDGLTAQTWNYIEATIRTLTKEGVIKWTPQEP